jgi:hypothetical protein
MIYWPDVAMLGNVLLGGVVGKLIESLAASAVWESGKWVAKPILDKIPDIASLVAQDASQGNHDLLRALRRAECTVMVSLCDEVLRELDFRTDRTELTERLALWLRHESSTDLAALCRIRRAFARTREELRTASVDDLPRHGAGLENVPILVKAGNECFESRDAGAMRKRVVEKQKAALDSAVRGRPADMGLMSSDGSPLAPNGLPGELKEEIDKHWWDFLVLAFREELKDNERARAAWEFDVLSQLPQQLGATYEQFEVRLSALESRASSTWLELTALRQQFDISTVMILDLLQRTIETTHGTRLAVEELHRLSETEFNQVKRLIVELSKQQSYAASPAVLTPLVDYCRYLDNMLARLLPLGTDGHNTWSAKVTLDQVYVELETGGPGKVVNDDPAPLSVLEEVAKHKQLVLLGDAGSGKSTFVAHLARQLASRVVRPDSRQQTMQMGWLRDGDIPIRIVVRDFAAWRASTSTANGRERPRVHSGDASGRAARARLARSRTYAERRPRYRPVRWPRRGS